jgi:uncharacterized Zn finger protein (UPF0148 family)
VPGFGEPVCRDCGKPLGLTKKGRMRWAQRCPVCAHRYWVESQPVEERRKKETEKKRRQRAKAKNPPKKGK